MFGIGLAAAKAYFSLSGVAGAAAGSITAPLLEDQPPFLEWFLRTFIAFAKIVLSFPKGTLVTGGEIVANLLGEMYAPKVEQTLRTITSLPQIMQVLSFILQWAPIPMAIAMFFGTASYWLAYMNQSSKSRSLANRIWGGKTLIVNPVQWFLYRFLPISVVFTVAFELAMTIIVELWKGVVWFVDFIYAEGGTTLGDSFQITLENLAESGRFGLIIFLAVFIVMVFILIRLTWRYLLRIRDFVVANYLILWDFGKYLDGSKITTLKEPIKAWLTSFFWIAITVILTWLAPLAASKISSQLPLGDIFSYSALVGAFIFCVVLDLAYDIQRILEKWGFSRRGLNSLKQKIEGIGDWIDQDITSLTPHPATQLPSIGGLVSGGVKAGAGYLVDQIPDSLKTAGEVALDVAKMHPKVRMAATGIQAARDVRDKLRDRKTVAEEISSRVWGTVSSPENPRPSPQWNREYALARTVLEKRQLMEMYPSLRSKLDYAVFHELAQRYHTTPQMERFESLRERIQSELTEMDIRKLAPMGESLARHVEDLLKERSST